MEVGPRPVGARMAARREPEVHRLGGGEEAWEALVRLLGVLPDGVVVVDAAGRIVHVNRPLEWMSGYPACDLLGEPVEVLVPEAARELHRRERESFGARPRVRPMAAGRDLALRRRDGTLLPVDIALSPLRTEEGLLVLAAVRDASDRRAAEGELRRRAAMLAAVAGATERFLRAARCEEVLPEVLPLLGRATGAGRVSAFRIERDGGGRFARLAHEWAAEGVEPQAGNPALARIPEGAGGLARWWRVLETGGLIEGPVASLPPEERPFLEAQGVRSVLVAPVLVGGEWWGTLSLADTKEERAWPVADVEAVRAVAGALGEALAREAAVDRLRASETRYRSLVEHMPAVTYLMAPGAPGPITYISSRVCDVLGYPPEQFETDPGFWVRVLHPGDRDRVLSEWRRANETGEPFSLEYRYLARDGRVVWVHDSCVLVGGAEGYWQGVLVDVTDRVRAEEELRESYETLRRVDALRRRLAAELVRTGEAERARIAADIHDDPLQKLTALALRLEVAAGDGRDAALSARLGELAGLARTVIGSLRRLVFEVHPPALDREGLAAALRQYLRAGAERHGYAFSLEDRLLAEPPTDTRVVCYRILQEALANVGKHARASRVEVALESRDGGVQARVSDDGVGFDAQAVEVGVPGRFGIGLMRERAELAGGWLRLQSAPGSGTTVEFWVPLGGSAGAGGTTAA